MRYFLLTYAKVEDFATRQQAFAEAHRAHIQRFVSEGSLLFGGNLEGPHALLLFRCADDRDVRRFAAEDPYVIEGIVCNWTLGCWDVVVGSLIPPQ